MDKGCFYRNDVWFSPAYQRLTNSARDLLQCLWTEIIKREIKKEAKIKSGKKSIFKKFGEAKTLSDLK